MAAVMAGMAAANLIGGMLADKANRKAAAQAQQIEQKRISDAIRELEAIGMPSEEARRLVLEEYGTQEEQQVENLQDSSLEDIRLDPQYKEAQMDALNEMMRAGQEGGLTDEDKLKFDQVLDASNQENQANQKSILNTMAQQGTLDSGSALIAKLNANANSTQQASDRGRDLALASSQARRDALSQAANMSNTMQNNEFQRAQTVANAKDTINKYNAVNRQNVGNANVTTRNQTGNANTDIRNQNSKNAIDAKLSYNDAQLDRYDRTQGLYNKQASGQADYATQEGARKAAAFGKIGSAAGDLIGGFGTKSVKDGLLK